MTNEKKMIALGKDPADYIKNAVEELLNHVFMAEMSSEDYDALIDELGSCVKLKLGIEDDEKIDWEAIEDHVYHYSNTLASTLEMSEIMAILKSIKFKNDDFNDISGKIDIQKIKKQIVKDFEEFYSVDYEHYFIVKENAQ